MSEDASTRCGSEGTIGNLGGREVEDKYWAWVTWEFFIIFQTLLTWVGCALTSGY